VSALALVLQTIFHPI